MKRYKLLKDTHTGMKAGEVFFYNYDGKNYHSEGSNPTHIIADTNIVENNPEWFQPIEEEYEGYGKRVRQWDNKHLSRGFFIDLYGEIKQWNGFIDRHLSATENIAKSQLAQSQLSQLLVLYWGDWRPNFGDHKQEKYTIIYHDGEIDTDYGHKTAHFLSFPNIQMCNDFLEDHKQLIEQYFLMYQW